MSKLEEKQAYCAKLIENSVLDDRIREILLEDISGLEEPVLDKLIESLEREQSELKKLGAILGKLDRPLDEQWKCVERKQDDASNKMADNFIADLVRDKIKGINK